MTSSGSAQSARLAVPELIEAGPFATFDPSAEIVDFGGGTMGTHWKVRLALPRDRDHAPLAVAVQTRLDGIVAEMSHWDPASLLCRYNLSSSGSWTVLPSDFAEVIAAALQVAQLSAGAFDPAMGRLTDLWGLGPRQAAGLPEASAVADALAASGWQRLTFDAAAARLRQPGGLWLDLSGIAKGYAADAVADCLAAFGIHHALVEVGGECVGRGLRPDGDPWWVEVEAPPGFSLPPLRVALHQLAVATSGDYLGGAHNLDPATGYPPLHSTTAVSVLHSSCMLADAWAGALSVLPPKQAQELAEQQHLAVRLVTRDKGEWLSGSLQAML